MDKEATVERMEEMLGSPVDISTITETSPLHELTKLAFELYRETARVGVIASHLCESFAPSRGSVPRDQAIALGLIVRISKFMCSVMALVCDGVREHGDVILGLNRCITESAVKLLFFCGPATKEDHDTFVRSSLKAEKELFELIQENIKSRGREQPIETRMLRSINRVFQDSGVNGIAELKSLPRFKDFRTILRELGNERAYACIQAVPSHQIHGTWVDLLASHLEKAEEGFRPKAESRKPDARALGPVSILGRCPGDR